MYVVFGIFIVMILLAVLEICNLRKDIATLTERYSNAVDYLDKTINELNMNIGAKITMVDTQREIIADLKRSNADLKRSNAALKGVITKMRKSDP